MCFGSSKKNVVEYDVPVKREYPVAYKTPVVNTTQQRPTHRTQPRVPVPATPSPGARPPKVSFATPYAMPASELQARRARVTSSSAYSMPVSMPPPAFERAAPSPAPAARRAMSSSSGAFPVTISQPPPTPTAAARRAPSSSCGNSMAPAKMPPAKPPGVTPRPKQLGGVPQVVPPAPKTPYLTFSALLW